MILFVRNYPFAVLREDYRLFFLLFFLFARAVSRAILLFFLFGFVVRLFCFLAQDFSEFVRVVLQHLYLFMGQVCNLFVGEF